MALSNIRIKLIKSVIDLNEKIFFERKIRKFYRSAGTINTVIDVGANKGQSIDFFLAMNPSCTVYAVEPNPELFALLTKKYHGKKNIHLFNAGISDKAGEKIFFENVFDYTSSFEELNMDSEYLKKKANVLGVKKEAIVKKSYPVHTMTLAQLIAQENIAGPVDVLKVDTEGHEYYCLKGLFDGTGAEKVKFIQLENHNDDMYANRVGFDEISSLLVQNNFREAKRIAHGFGDFEEVVFSRES
jgi:FkbM family methyltransferase